MSDAQAEDDDPASDWQVPPPTTAMMWGEIARLRAVLLEVVHLEEPCSSWMQPKEVLERFCLAANKAETAITGAPHWAVPRHGEEKGEP